MQNDGQGKTFNPKNNNGGVAEANLSCKGKPCLSTATLPFNKFIMAFIPEGCILIARKVRGSKIWEKPAWWYKVFCYLIMEVAYKDGNNPRGTGYFKYSTIYDECHLENDTKNKANVDNVIRFMRSSGICTTRKTTRGIYITLCKYKDYQNIKNYKNDTPNEKRTRQERDRNETIPKEGKEGKESNKIDSPMGTPLSDQDFLSSLKTNPAYTGIDTDHELAKMDTWLLARPGRKKTRRFIVNWLNKTDKPVETKAKAKISKPEKLPERSPVTEEDKKRIKSLIATALKKQ